MRRPELQVFSLSFLDLLSCAFGGVVLLVVVFAATLETEQHEDTGRFLFAEIEVVAPRAAHRDLEDRIARDAFRPRVQVLRGNERLDDVPLRLGDDLEGPSGAGGLLRWTRDFERAPLERPSSCTGRYYFFATNVAPDVCFVIEIDPAALKPGEEARYQAVSPGKPIESSLFVAGRSVPLAVE
jgi:hypothetical protein